VPLALPSNFTRFTSVHHLVDRVSIYDILPPSTPLPALLSIAPFAHLVNTMPALPVNGTATPPATDDSSAPQAVKRKRASTEDAPHTNGVLEPSAEDSDLAVRDPSLPDVLTDILTVLRM
jgi:hypothetical protein